MTALPSLKSLSQPSTLRSLWGVLRAVPGGGKLMGRIVGRMAPYTGTIRPEVLELDQGWAKVCIADRPFVRNHLRSVHAIALMNLGEAVTGLAVMYSLPDGARGIPNKLSMEYLKKARGRITAEARCEVPSVITERFEREFVGELKDEAGDVVARITAQWVIGPSH